jgi:hypothetical protein
LLVLSRPAVLAWHSHRYPLLQAWDIYKLIHQGAFGPGHMIAGAAQARRMLEEETAALEAGSSKSKGRMPESAFEPIDPRGRLVRVNLRPLLRMRAEGAGTNAEGSLDVDWLAGALVESARKVDGDADLMRRRLASAVRWCRQKMPEQAARLERLAAQASESDYPAFHHSPTYLRAYRPAYRVVLSACLRRPRVSGRVG